MCTPGGEDGNFIMFARATSGDKKNNNKFSPCSLRAIEPVLNSKARSGKGCFTGKIRLDSATFPQRIIVHLFCFAHGLSASSHVCRASTSDLRQRCSRSG